MPKGRIPKIKVDIKPNEPSAGKQRTVAFFWYNLPIHSGARVHDYQIIQSIAQSGFKVISYSNAVPPFLGDYKNHPNITWLIKPDLNSLPPIDLVICSPGPMERVGITFANNKKIPIWLVSYGPLKWCLSEMGEQFPDEAIIKDRHLKADLVITSSEMAKEKFIEWIPEVNGRIEVVKPYINFGKFPETLPEKKNKTLTYCGRIQAYKGYQEFLRWGNEYRNKFCRELELNLIATGAVEERSRWTIQFNPIDNIPEDKKFEIMASSMAGFVPSRMETFGLVPGEFIALKVPVIVLDIPQLRREYGDTLIYVNNQNDFFKAMDEIINCPPINCEMNPAQKAELSSNRMINQLKTLIEGKIK